MRLAKIKGTTFLSAIDIVDMIREVNEGQYTELADEIEALVFSAELDLDMGPKGE